MALGNGECFAGRNEEVLERMGDWIIAYEVGMIVWIVFGLGYIFMIVTVIADSLRRPARRAAKRIKAAEKVMVSRILHEIMLMKTKV